MSTRPKRPRGTWSRRSRATRARSSSRRARAGDERGDRAPRRHGRAPRARGEPLQYVLGRWQFLGHRPVRRPARADPATRDRGRRDDRDRRGGARAARVAVGAIRGRARRRRSRSPTSAPVRVRLALALASDLPDAEVWATDVSTDALAVARANLAGAGSSSTRIRLAAGSWFDALPDALARLAAPRRDQPAVRRGARGRVAPPRDPRLGAAWRARQWADAAPRRSTRSSTARARLARSACGVLVCELAPHQAAESAGRARAAGFADVSVRRDLAGPRPGAGGPTGRGLGSAS